MALHLPPYQPLPAPDPGEELLELPLRQLRPTQLCIGLAEIRSRIGDFAQDSTKQRRAYLATKPVPLVRNPSGVLWMVALSVTHIWRFRQLRMRESTWSQ